MKKKILIGSLLVLTLLLLMPSIPAVQQKSIEEGFKQEIQEKLETITLDGLKDIEVLDGIRHPILYLWVILRRDLRMEICKIIFYSHTFMSLLGIIMVWARLKFWHNVSEIRGWGWDVYDF